MIHVPGYEGYKVVKINQAFFPGSRGWVRVGSVQGEPLERQYARLLASGATCFNFRLERGNFDKGTYQKANPDFKASEIVVEKICAQCRNGWEGKGEVSERDENGFAPQYAEYWVEGRRYVDGKDRMVPYRGFLCGGHVEIALYDGADFKIEWRVS